jgi:hypothetical protein
MDGYHDAVGSLKRRAGYGNWLVCAEGGVPVEKLWTPRNHRGMPEVWHWVVWISFVTWSTGEVFHVERFF